MGTSSLGNLKLGKRKDNKPRKKGQKEKRVKEETTIQREAQDGPRSFGGGTSHLWEKSGSVV